jgi:hypothetical protein
MDRERIGANRPAARSVHRAVVRLALGAMTWTVLAIWILFSHSYYGILLFGVVTFLVSMFVVLPWVLSRFNRRREPAADSTQTFREWREGRFETGSGPVDARDAAIMILLIPMAVAVGFTAIGLLEFLTAEGVLT